MMHQSCVYCAFTIFFSKPLMMSCMQYTYICTIKKQHSFHNFLENSNKKEKKYQKSRCTNGKTNESTGDEFLATIETVVNETIGIENDGSTANDNNKISNTTTKNPTEGDGNECSHIDSSNISELCTNESNNEKENDISESMT